MLRYLYARQLGLLNDVCITNHVQNERIKHLELHKLYDVDNIFPGGVDTLDIDPAEYRYLLSGCADGSIFIHDVYNFSGKPQFTARCVSRRNRGHLGSVEAVTWIGPDNGVFATSGTDRFLKLWDANQFCATETYFSKGKIYHHAPGRAPGWEMTIAIGTSTGVVELIDLRTGSSSHELRGHLSPVLATAWSPRFGSMLATGGTDGCVRLWDIRAASGDSRNLNRHGRVHIENSGSEAHSGMVNGLIFTGDGLYLLSSGTENQLRLWNIYRLAYEPVNYGRIPCKNPHTLRRHVQLDIANGTKPQTVFVPSKGGVCVMNLMTGEIIRELTGHFNRVNCCVLREPFGELYTGGNDRNIIVWSADRMPKEEPERKPTSFPLTDNWGSDNEEVTNR